MNTHPSKNEKSAKNNSRSSKGSRVQRMGTNLGSVGASYLAAANPQADRLQAASHKTHLRCVDQLRLQLAHDVDAVVGSLVPISHLLLSPIYVRLKQEERAIDDNERRRQLSAVFLLYLYLYLCLCPCLSLVVCVSLSLSSLCLFRSVSCVCL